MSGDAGLLLEKNKEDKGFINDISINSNNYVISLDLSAFPDSVRVWVSPGEIRNMAAAAF